MRSATTRGARCASRWVIVSSGDDAPAGGRMVRTKGGLELGIGGRARSMWRRRSEGGATLNVPISPAPSGAPPRCHLRRRSLAQRQDQCRPVAQMNASPKMAAVVAAVTPVVGRGAQAAAAALAAPGPVKPARAQG